MSILDNEDILLHSQESIKDEKIKIIEDIINTPQVKHKFSMNSKIYSNERPEIYNPDDEVLWELENDYIKLNGQYFISKTRQDMPIVIAPSNKTPILFIGRMLPKYDVNFYVNYDLINKKMRELNKIDINKIKFWKSLNKLYYIGNINCDRQIKNADDIEIIDKFIYNYQDRNINKDILINLGSILNKQFPKLEGIMQLNTNTFILSPNTKGLKISQIKIGPGVNTEPNIYINIDGCPVLLTYKDIYNIYNFDNIMKQGYSNEYDLNLLLAERDRMYFIVDEIKKFFKNNPYVTDIIFEHNLNLYDKLGLSNRERISFKTLIQRYDNSKV